MGRKKQYVSDAEKQAAYRKRKRNEPAARDLIENVTSEPVDPARKVTVWLFRRGNGWSEETLNVSELHSIILGN